MRPLLWKEWHEQAWKLGYGCLVLSLMAIIELHARILPDSEMANFLLAIGVVLLPMLATTGLIPAEREQGSLEMLISLPYPAKRILLVKVIMGVLQCTLPFVAVALACIAMAGSREMLISHWLMIFAGAAATSTCLLFWMMALTIRLPSEARAGMVAIGVLVMFAMIDGACNDFYFVTSARPFPNEGLGMYLSTLLPLSPLASSTQGNYPILTIIPAQLIIAAALWLIASPHFSRLEETP